MLTRTSYWLTHPLTALGCERFAYLLTGIFTYGLRSAYCILIRPTPRSTAGERCSASRWARRSARTAVAVSPQRYEVGCRSRPGRAGGLGRGRGARSTPARRPPKFRYSKLTLSYLLASLRKRSVAALGGRTRGSGSRCAVTPGRRGRGVNCSLLLKGRLIILHHQHNDDPLQPSRTAAPRSQRGVCIAQDDAPLSCMCTPQAS